MTAAMDRLTYLLTLTALRMHWNVVVNRHLVQAAASGGTLAGTHRTEVTLLLEISKSYWGPTQMIMAVNGEHSTRKGGKKRNVTRLLSFSRIPTV
jgi:hypothetical protein